MERGLETMQEVPVGKDNDVHGDVRQWKPSGIPWRTLKKRKKRVRRSDVNIKVSIDNSVGFSIWHLQYNHQALVSCSVGLFFHRSLKRSDDFLVVIVCCHKTSTGGSELSLEARCKMSSYGTWERRPVTYSDQGVWRCFISDLQLICFVS